MVGTGIRLDIKDSATVRLARELASKSGKSVTETIRTALENADAEREAEIADRVRAVLTRRFRGEFDEQAERLLPALWLLVIPVTPEQAIIGRDAYRLYGIGSCHPARLNFGDCFAYALSKASGEPPLFKADDFGHTDGARVAI